MKNIKRINFFRVQKFNTCIDCLIYNKLIDYHVIILIPSIFYVSMSTDHSCIKIMFDELKRN